MIAHYPINSSRFNPCHKRPTAPPLFQVTAIKIPSEEGAPIAHSIPQLALVLLQEGRLEASELEVSVGRVDQGGKVERGPDLYLKVCIFLVRFDRFFPCVNSTLYSFVRPVSCGCDVYVKSVNIFKLTNFIARIRR